MTPRGLSPLCPLEFGYRERVEVGKIAASAKWLRVASADALMTAFEGPLQKAHQRFHLFRADAIGGGEFVKRVTSQLAQRFWQKDQRQSTVPRGSPKRQRLLANRAVLGAQNRAGDAV